MINNKKHLLIGIVIGSLGSFLITTYLAINDIRDLASELKLSQKKHELLETHAEVTLMRHLDNNFNFVMSYARENPDSKTLAILLHEIQEHNSLFPDVSNNKDWFARGMLLMLVKAHELSEKSSQGNPENFLKLAKDACMRIYPAPKSCEITDLRKMLVAFEAEDTSYIAEYFGTKVKAD